MDPKGQLLGVTRPEVLLCSNHQGRENASQHWEGEGKVKEERGEEGSLAIRKSGARKELSRFRMVDRESILIEA